MADGELNDLGRFAQPALLILVSPAGGVRQGHAVAEDVRNISRIDD